MDAAPLDILKLDFTEKDPQQSLINDMKFVEMDLILSLSSIEMMEILLMVMVEIVFV